MNLKTATLIALIFYALIVLTRFLVYSNVIEWVDAIKWIYLLSDVALVLFFAVLYKNQTNKEG
jgi:hypothetical protein